MDATRAAPCIGEGGWSSDETAPLTGLGARLPAQMRVYLYQGTEDETTPLEHVALYQRAIPQAVVRRLTGRNHQLNNDLSEVVRPISGRSSAFSETGRSRLRPQ